MVNYFLSNWFSKKKKIGCLLRMLDYVIKFWGYLIMIFKGNLIEFDVKNQAESDFYFLIDFWF